MKKIKLLVAILAAGGVFMTNCPADLDEGEFADYREGDLNQQRGWDYDVTGVSPQEAKGRVVVVREGDGKNHVRFCRGSDGAELSRVFKRFPPTTLRRVLIKLDFIPGSNNVGGRLYFQEQDRSLFGIQFIKGRIHLALGAQQQAHLGTDTGVEFEPSKWNRLEFRVDLDAKRLQGFLNGTSFGTFDLKEAFDCLSTVNFYGGGPDFESRLQDLSILSVDKFPDNDTSSGKR